MTSKTKAELLSDIGYLEEQIEKLEAINSEQFETIMHHQNLEDENANENEAVKSENRMLREEHARVLDLLAKERIRTKRLLRDTISAFTDPTENGFGALIDYDFEEVPF